MDDADELLVSEATVENTWEDAYKHVPIEIPTLIVACSVHTGTLYVALAPEQFSPQVAKIVADKTAEFVRDLAMVLSAVVPTIQELH